MLLENKASLFSCSAKYILLLISIFLSLLVNLDN